MASKKPGFIPEIDILKSGGVTKLDALEGKRDEDGYVKMTRTQNGIESRNRAVTIEMTEQQEKLRRLKEIAEGYGMTKQDIKDMKEDIEDDKRENEEKKKKKNKLMDPYFTALIGSGALPDEFADYIKDGGEKGKKKKKKKKKKKDKERSQLAGMTVKEKKDKKKDGDKKDKPSKDDKERSEVAERFREVEKISRKNMGEIDDTIDLINGRLEDLTSSAERLKNRDYVISNYISAKSSLISTRQKIATDIGANRAKIYEIEMKKEKSAKDASASDADMIARLFPGVVLGGKTGDLAKYVAETGKNKDSKKKKKKKHWEDYDDIPDDDELDRRERKLLEDGDLEYSKYDQNIEWENRATIAIKKSFRTGEWKFIALDDEGNIIRDFPKSHLPSKKTCQMKFDDERDIALDTASNRSYQVLSVPEI